MKKTILLCGLLATLLQGCSYRPIIDTAGRSGTFNNDQAKENTTFVGNIVYWSLSPTMDTKYESITRKCLTQRGHSILN